MPQMTTAKLPALGMLLVAFALLVVACSGDTTELTVLTPTPALEPTAVSAPGLATSPTMEPTAAPPTPIVVAATDSPTMPPAPVPTVATVPAPKPGQIELRFVIMKRNPDDTVTPLEDGGVMTADNFYGIYFEPATDAYVYVLQQDSTKAIDVLFPNPDYSGQTNPVAAGTPVWVPNDIDNWFFLDETVGKETFFVVATKERNQELEDILASHQREETLGPLAGFLTSGARGAGGVKKLDKEPIPLSDGESLVLEPSLLQGSEGDFVHTVEFDHK